MTEGALAAHIGEPEEDEQIENPWVRMGTAMS
jgi:hypothetical protein